MLINFANPKQGDFNWINQVKKILNNEKWYSSR
jgi:hypothetical protein